MRKFYVTTVFLCEGCANSQCQILAVTHASQEAKPSVSIWHLRQRNPSSHACLQCATPQNGILVMVHLVVVQKVSTELQNRIILRDLQSHADGH